MSLCGFVDNPLDLRHTPINEQFDAGEITAVIRREEQNDFRDFVRSSHPTQRYGGYYTRLELLKLFSRLHQATEARCVYWTRTDGVDTDLAAFQIDRPGAREERMAALVAL